MFESFKSDIYYRIILSCDETEWVVVTMQDFDEYDYNQKRFFNETKYETEEKAQAVIDMLNGIDVKDIRRVVRAMSQ